VRDAVHAPAARLLQASGERIVWAPAWLPAGPRVIGPCSHALPACHTGTFSLAQHGTRQLRSCSCQREGGLGLRCPAQPEARTVVCVLHAMPPRLLNASPTQRTLRLQPSPCAQVETIALDEGARNGAGSVPEIVLLNLDVSRPTSEGPNPHVQRLSKSDKAKALAVLCKDGWLARAREREGHYCIGVRLLRGHRGGSCSLQLSRGAAINWYPPLCATARFRVPIPRPLHHPLRIPAWVLGFNAHSTVAFPMRVAWRARSTSMLASLQQAGVCSCWRRLRWPLLVLAEPWVTVPEPWLALSGCPCPAQVRTFLELSTFLFALDLPDSTEHAWRQCL
jgi:hypothetical protein